MFYISNKLTNCAFVPCHGAYRGLESEVSSMAGLGIN
jgi:hypothetical protein